MEIMTKEEEIAFIKNSWERHFQEGTVFPRIKGLLSVAKHHKESGFKDVWAQLNIQLISSSQYESNENGKKHHFDNIGDVYSSDFMMINRLLDFYRQTWGELYTEELVGKIKAYVKQFEKYIKRYV